MLKDSGSNFDKEENTNIEINTLTFVVKKNKPSYRAKGTLLLY